MPPKKLQSNFRGINVYLYSTDKVVEAPPSLSGLENLVVDRWHPVTPDDKKASTKLAEIFVGWVPVNGNVVYGVERWGEFIPQNYTEWFSIVVVHPLLTNSDRALKLAEQGDWRNASPDEA